jgi:hypothetical protein
MPYNGANFMERVFLEQLIQLFNCRNCPPFTKSKGSLLCSQETVTGPYAEADESSPPHHGLFLF